MKQIFSKPFFGENVAQDPAQFLAKTRPLSQKTEIAAPTLWRKSRRQGVPHRYPPNRYEEDTIIERNEEPTQN